MDTSKIKINKKALDEINDKAIQNQLFTPDRVYMDLGLFKDIPLGVIYADKVLFKKDKEGFEQIQKIVLENIEAYQKRRFDSVIPYLSRTGYTDIKLDMILKDLKVHDQIFMMAPTTKFLNYIIRHTIRNQNNSRPGNKYTKKSLGGGLYSMEAIPITYFINTYPLTLSIPAMESLGKELGEALGVNIKFLNKNPSLFDEDDWDIWLKDIECFYLDSLGRFTASPFCQTKQEEMAFANCYVFARKRFERHAQSLISNQDFDHEIQMLTATCDIFFDFTWMQNNDSRLTEQAEDIPFEKSAEEEADSGA